MPLALVLQVLYIKCLARFMYHMHCGWNNTNLGVMVHFPDPHNRPYGVCSRCMLSCGFSLRLLSCLLYAANVSFCSTVYHFTNWYPSVLWCCLSCDVCDIYQSEHSFVILFRRSVVCKPFPWDFQPAAGISIGSNNLIVAKLCSWACNCY